LRAAQVDILASIRGGSRHLPRVDASLFTLSFGLFIIGIDYTVLNVAMLDIRESLGAGLEALQWIFGIFALVSGATVLAIGAAAERLGRRRVYVSGIAWFTLSSALCAAAWSPTILIVARGAQGLGVAMVGTATFGLVVDLYEGNERRRALGLVSAISALSFVIGPFLGAMVVELADWRWVFFINLPLGAAAALLGVRYLPRSEPDDEVPAVRLGQTLLLTLSLLAFAWFALRGDQVGWTSSQAIGALVVGFLCIGLFIVYEERRAERALLPLDLFGRRDVVGPLVAVGIVQGAFAGWLVYFLLEMQGLLGFTPAEVGLGLLIEVIPFSIAAPMGAGLADKLGAARAASLGCAGVAVGFLAIAATGHQQTLITLAPGLLLLGFFGGLIPAPLESAALGALPTERSGMGGGLTATFRNVGVTFGVAGLGVILQASIAAQGMGARLTQLAGDAAVSRAPAAAQDAVSGAFSSGFQLVTLCAAALYIVAGLTALATTRTCPYAKEPDCAPSPLPRAGTPPATIPKAAPAH
jgi:EmrB/QacA subfamily drug resistance transporter